MLRFALEIVVAAGLSIAASSVASAKSCAELRALCWTMRDQESDRTRPQQADEWSGGWSGFRMPAKRDPQPGHGGRSAAAVLSDAVASVEVFRQNVQQ